MKALFILIISLFAFSFVKGQTWWGSSGNPNNDITINWSSIGANDSIQWGFSPLLEKGKFPAIQRTGISGYFYSYIFQGQMSDSIIYYSIYNSSLDSQEIVQTYKLPINTNYNCFSFNVMGDSRTNYSTWEQIALLANQHKTDFSIHLGDVVDNGSNTLSWTQWFNSGITFLNNNLVYYCVGNHEANDTALFQNIFTLPNSQNTELYYSFEYGNAVFICLNSEYITNEQTQWLYSTLQNYKDKTWKIVFFHRPFYSIGYHIGEMDAYLDTWWKAFDSVGVDLILSGHEHMYERTKPINYSVSPYTPVSEYGSNFGQGRCEIVSGGAGGPLYAGTPDIFTQAYAPLNHICKISICGNTLVDSTFNLTDSLIDTFVLDKTNSIVGNKNNEDELKIYPNPVNENISLQLNNNFYGEIKVEIIRSDGKKLKSITFNKSSRILNAQLYLQNLSEGMYILKATFDHKELKSTFIKK